MPEGVYNGLNSVSWECFHCRLAPVLKTIDAKIVLKTGASESTSTVAYLISTYACLIQLILKQQTPSHT